MHVIRFVRVPYCLSSRIAVKSPQPESALKPLGTIVCATSVTNTMLREGTTIVATSFADDKQFNVKLISSRPVADGGTAKIFLARADATDQLGDFSSSVVALKWFVNNMAAFQQQLLNRELRAVRQVRHPYILPYIGTAVFDFNKILIAPYMMNGNLIQYLERHKNLDRRPLVATAVDFLHVDHKIIHGDLKCENVLVADDGSTRLADFGLSTIIERTDGSTRTATALRQPVTIQFAAPELLLGEGDSQAGESGRPARRTTQTDVYAFGMLVVQAFTGRPPWSGFGSAEILMKLQRRVVHPRPANRLPHVVLSDLWWNSCLMSWDYDPSKRPTMRQLMDNLHKELAGGVGERSTTSLIENAPHVGDDQHDAEENDSPVPLVLPEPARIIGDSQRDHTPTTLHWGRVHSQLQTEERTRRWGLYLGEDAFDLDAGRGSWSTFAGFDNGSFHGSFDRVIPASPPPGPSRVPPMRRSSRSLPERVSPVQNSAPDIERPVLSLHDSSRVSWSIPSVLGFQHDEISSNAESRAPPRVLPFIARKPKPRSPSEPPARDRWTSRPQGLSLLTFSMRRNSRREDVKAATTPAEERPGQPLRQKAFSWVDRLEPDWLRRTRGD